MPTFKHVAIGTGQGGYNTTYKCEIEEQDDEEPEKDTDNSPTVKKEDNLMLGIQDLLSDIEDDEEDE